MAWIYDKNGQQKCEVKKLSYNGVFMDVSSITVTVESAEPIAFGIGDYIDWDYDGLRYTLDTAAGVEKQARRNSIGNAFTYDNLVFLSPLSAAGNADFLDVVLGNTNDFLTNTQFSFYGTAWDYAKRLEANLCRLYGEGSWKIRIWTNGTCYDESPATGITTGSWENKLVDVSGIKCLGGFQQIYDLWGCAYVFSVDDGVNYVDFYDDFELYAKAWKAGGVDKIFAYGKGNGLYKIRHTADADHVLVTRLRAYGSSDNLPANYYLNSSDYHVDGNESSELAISHLMLPASQWTKGGVKSPANAYLEQNTELYGVREASVYWDGSDSELGEIKPTIYGLTIQDLLDLMASGTTYRPVESKWPDTAQRIDKIITGVSPTDNGAVAEAGYDFTVVEASGSTTAHDFGVTRINHDVEFNDLLMGVTPSVSHLAEFRIVPTSSNKKVASFDVPGEIASRVSAVTAYITPYVNGVKVEDATFPCAVSIETISNTVSGVLYTKRCNISLLDATENPIVFSTMLTGPVTFRIRANVVFNAEMSSGFSVIRNEYAVSFNLLRGNKAIDKFFSVTIPQVGFDLAAAVSGAAKLCMRSGYNQPREFQIVPSSVRYISASDTWYLRCKRAVDQSTQTYFPNSDAVIAAGDEYYLAGIAMPSLYVEIAAQKLLAAATAWLDRHSKPRMLSSVDVDNKIMAVEGIVLKEGMSLPLSDADLDITPETQESRVIDNIRIEEGTSSIRTFTITLRDKKEKSSLDAAIRGATSNFATNTSVSEAVSAVESRDHGSLSGRDMPNQHPITAITGLEEALASLTFFEEDGNGNIKLKDEYGGFWAQGFVTAGGIGSGGGGGDITLADVWRSLTNDPELIPSDITNTTPINALHIPIGSGLAIDSQTGNIIVTAQGTVTGVALGSGTTPYSPVNGIITLPAYPTALASPYALTVGSKTYDGSAAVIIDKSDIGLGNVTNDAQVKRTEMGAASGVATLGSDGKVPSSQLPSYVDDVLEYADLAHFPATGESGKIYVALDTNKTYRWSGTAYVEISPSIVIGTTTGTAFDGGSGYSHVTNGDIHVTATQKTNWDTAYGWGDHANAGYLLATTAANTYATVASLTSKGSASMPIYFDANHAAQEITSLDLLSKTTGYVKANRYYVGSSGTGTTAWANGQYLVWDDTNKAWHLVGNFYADGFITAGGVGSGGGGGGGLVQQIFRIGDFGGVFDTSANDTFNAYAINSLYTSIQSLSTAVNDKINRSVLWASLQNNDNVNTYDSYKIHTNHLPSISGTGITGTYSISGTAPNLSTSLSLSVDVATILGYTPVAKTGDTMTGALTIATSGESALNIGSSTSGVYGAIYLYASGTKYTKITTAATGAYQTITIPNATGTLALTSDLSAYLPLAGGTMSNTNVVTNLNADLLDGLDSGRFFRKNLISDSADCNSMEDNSFTILDRDAGGLTCANKPSDASIAGGYGVLTVKHGGYRNQLFFPYTGGGDVYTRSAEYYNDAPNWRSWYKIYHSGNSNLTTVPWTAQTLKVGTSSLNTASVFSAVGTSLWTADLRNNRCYVALCQDDGRGIYVSSTRYTSSAGIYLLNLEYGASNVGDSGYTAMYVRADGNVGIGTNAPEQLLHTRGAGIFDLPEISGVDTALTLSSQNSSGGTTKNKGVAIRLGHDTNGTYCSKIACVFEDQNPNYLQPSLAFYTMYNSYAAGSEVERMRIASNGNVGIGTNSPSYKLDVAGTICGGGSGVSDGIKIKRAYDGWEAYTIGSVDATSYVMEIRNESGIGSFITLDSAQRIGIMTNTPSYTLDVAGVIHSSTGSFSDGYVTAGAAQSASDMRLKGNIRDLQRDPIALIKLLKPREWDWNQYSTVQGHAMGFVAQEVQNYLPFMIGSVKDKHLGNRLTLGYEQFHALWAAGLQNHESRIDKLERENKEFRKENNELRLKIQELQNRLQTINN